MANSMICKFCPHLNYLVLPEGRKQRNNLTAVEWAGRWTYPCSFCGRW